MWYLGFHLNLTLKVLSLESWMAFVLGQTVSHIWEEIVYTQCFPNDIANALG